MRIGVDMDGVLADFDKGLVDAYNAHFDKSLEYKELEGWDSFLRVAHFGTHDEWWTWVRESQPDLFFRLPPIPGAIEGMNYLKSKGHKLSIITAKPIWAGPDAMNWLRLYDIPFDEFHLCNEKHNVKCDWYIDDSVHNIESLIQRTDAVVVQFSPWPYVNRGVEVDNALLVRSWEELLEYL